MTSFVCFSLKTISLTMWDQFVTNESAVILELINSKPIIIAMRLKVVLHNGKISPKYFFFQYKLTEHA